MQVVVFGGTGYIGHHAVQELAKRGHSVVVIARQRSGIGGKQSLADVQSLFRSDNVSVVLGDVTDFPSLKRLLLSLRPSPQAAVCCLASRTGGPTDSVEVDYQATVNCIKACRAARCVHFVLLSAVCVQRPVLAFQRAKLQAEEELRRHPDAMSYSIVRPTAFFKSLLPQIDAVRNGAAFRMFGDGTKVRCKPISEHDLSSFMADCLWDLERQNRVLPVGGPGPALSFKEQGEMMFELLGSKPRFTRLPYALFSAIQAILDLLAQLFPTRFADLAEFGRIGRYYAEESMLVLDPVTGQYSEALTPSYGQTSFRAFLATALRGGSGSLAGQQLGEQGLREQLRAAAHLR